MADVRTCFMFDYLMRPENNYKAIMTTMFLSFGNFFKINSFQLVVKDLLKMERDTDS